MSYFFGSETDPYSAFLSFTEDHFIFEAKKLLDQEEEIVGEICYTPILVLSRSMEKYNTPLAILSAADIRLAVHQRKGKKTFGELLKDRGFEKKSTASLLMYKLERNY